MKTNLRQCTLLSACLVANTLSLTADPIQRADVAKEPAWVVHLDCDQLRQTTLGEHLLSEMDKPEARRRVAEFEAILRFDLRRDLHGLTLYGTSTKREEAVLLAYADFDAARLIAVAENAREHEITIHRTHDIHGWLDDKRAAKEGGSPRIFAAIHGQRVVVFGQQSNTVAKALDVIDGVAPRLGSREFVALGADKAAFLQAAATKIPLPAKDPNAAVLRQTQRVGLTLSEEERRVKASLSVGAPTAQVAEQIASIGRGILAWLSLQTENPQATQLAQALDIQHQGAEVTARLVLPAEEVVKMLRQRAEKKTARR